MRKLLAVDLRRLRGVGVKRYQLLNELDLRTLADLLLFLPARYQRREALRPLLSLAEEETALLQVRVCGAATLRYLSNQRSVLHLPVSDDSGSALATWFNQPYRRLQFPLDSEIWLRAKLEIYNGKRLLRVRECGLGRAPEAALSPVYHLRGRLGQGQYAKLVLQALEYWDQEERSDVWSKDRRAEWQLLSLGEALWQLHRPSSGDLLNQARRRLAFDQTCYERTQSFRERRRYKGFAMHGDAAVEKLWRHSLPFVLTASQEHCIAEIAQDMSDEIPMRRLLQGDVGSGKTAVASAAILRAITAGYQAALLAPTEILARQHQASLKKLLPDSVPVHLVLGTLGEGERRALAKESATAEPALWLGTHALLQGEWRLARLGLVIVDEQHRFGVTQRQELLRGREPSPDLLCLSATPIPRTLALALYGDLDISTLEQRPPGRAETRTVHIRNRERLQRFLTFCRDELAAGHKIYWVCPSIDAEPELNLAAVLARAPALSEIWPETIPLLLHGRLPEEERRQVTERFLYGDGQLLLGTTVVEVGLDQPLATVMVIENAERFGLAQLHQLRGRVGRGSLSSYCVLIAGTLEQLQQDERVLLSDTAASRLQALCESDDGFELAHLDLQLRGPGEVLGLAQSGFRDSYAMSWPLDEADLQRIEQYLAELSHSELKDLAARLNFWEGE